MTNKLNNVIKLLNRTFFSPDIKLFLYGCNDRSSIYFRGKSFFFFPVQKSLGSKVNDMTYVLKPLFFFDQVWSNFTKNNFNVGVIATCIIENKVSKFLFKTILLNDLNNLFRNNLIKMKANNLMQANKRCLKLHVDINIVNFNNNKSNVVAQGPHIK